RSGVGLEAAGRTAVALPCATIGDTTAVAQTAIATKRRTAARILTVPRCWFIREITVFEMSGKRESASGYKSAANGLSQLRARLRSLPANRRQKCRAPPPRDRYPDTVAQVREQLAICV